jgi:uncharacterized phage protein gp47/JayE
MSDLLSTKTTTEINDELDSAYKSSFGQHTDTSEHSVLGNIKAPVAIALGYVHGLLDFVVTQINPRTASGVYLDIVCSLNNIHRKKNSKSQAIVTFVGNSGTVVPKGTIVTTNDNIEFSTKQDEILIGTSLKVEVESVEYGIDRVAADTITNFTELDGISAVTNELASEAGELREADAELRRRRENSKAINSKSTIESMKANLLDLAGVSNAYVFESGDGYAIPISNPPSVYIYAIVDGGSSSDIAEVIAKTKTGGIPTIGTQSDTYTDLNGKVVTYYFDRPSEIEIKIKIGIVETNSQELPLNAVSQIQENLLEYLQTLNIGDNIYQSRAMSAINEVDGFVVDSFEIKKGDEDYSSSSISMAVNEVGLYSLENIEVRFQ